MPSTAFQWLSLVGIIWLQSINGTNTNFPAYSSQLKILLSISQVQLNNLAFASDAGKLFGWFSGVASLYLPLWLVLMIGSTLGLAGYGVQYLFITNQISSLSYWHVFLLTVLAGNSICWINTVCYVVTIRNFRSYSQIAVGLTTSYQGLSAKIYTDIVGAFFPRKRAKGFLFLNSILPLIASVAAAPLARDIDFRRPKNMGTGFIVIFLITIATGIYAVITSLEFISSKMSPFGNLISIGVSLLLLLVIPVAEKIKELVKSRYTNRERVYHFTVDENAEVQGVENEVTERQDASEVHEICVKETQDAERVEENGVKERQDASEVHEICVKERQDAERVQENGVKERQDASEVHEICVKEEVGVKLMLRRVDFWLYFFVYFLGATIGLVFLNNLGQIAESRGCSGTSSLVSLSSSFGFFGRLMPSLVDYFYRSKHVISRPACVLVLMVPTAGAFFLLLNRTDPALYISTAVIGICTGAITSISVSITTELFGTKNFSVNHNVVVANIPVGSFLFGYFAALIYRKEAYGQGKCMGMECFRKTFIVWGSLCFLGTFLALILYVRTRKFYSQRH
ncbi:protein NUCLEAR FUSION DEFECTIVE 4 [Quillaja saponaria]|uniref:Protein NUCLEAR FUSION DEFECTIVE 4 n=1 Tax=Quillaja saponaria TaxID=32244 RepID=A0AAD7LM88_QUISA|nr:protein NUCLEAR FUSION DEFECTIVE 4 [Quillaja saponaria]